MIIQTVDNIKFDYYYNYYDYDYYDDDDDGYDDVTGREVRQMFLN